MTASAQNVSVQFRIANAVNRCFHNRNMESFACRAHAYIGFLLENMMDFGALHARNIVQKKHAEYVL